LVGAGDGKIIKKLKSKFLGTLAKLSVQSMQISNKSDLLGAVTSITMTGDHTHFFCGTA